MRYTPVYKSRLTVARMIPTLYCYYYVKQFDLARAVLFILHPETLT